MLSRYPVCLRVIEDHSVFEYQNPSVTFTLKWAKKVAPEGSSFQLNTARRDRDLDNLVDALMTYFNTVMDRLDCVCLQEWDPVDGEPELLRYTVSPKVVEG